MTTLLPSWLPAVIAGGLIAAVGFAVVGVASAAVDWLWPQEPQEAAQAGTGGPNSPPVQSGEGEALTSPLSAFRDRPADPDALSGPQKPATRADPPAPHPHTQRPPHGHTDPKETP